MLSLNYKEFIYAYLMTIENKAKFIKEVTNVYSILLDTSNEPSTQDIASLIDEENEYIMMQVDCSNEIVNFYRDTYKHKLEFHVETVLNELGYTHSIVSFERSSYLHPLQKNIFTREELYKEDVYERSRCN